MNFDGNVQNRTRTHNRENVYIYTIYHSNHNILNCRSATFEVENKKKSRNNYSNQTTTLLVDSFINPCDLYKILECCTLYAR